MRARVALACFAVLTLVVFCVGPTPALAQELNRVRMPNDVGMELLGKAVVYSFYYQRTVTPYVGLEAGISALGSGGDDESTTIVFLPIGAKFYLIPKDGSVYLTGGASIVSASVDNGPFDEDDDDGGTNTYGYAGMGFEFRAESGFIFRGAAYGLISGGGFFIWPGLTVGYAF